MVLFQVNSAPEIYCRMALRPPLGCSNPALCCYLLCAHCAQSTSAKKLVQRQHAIDDASMDEDSFLPPYPLSMNLKKMNTCNIRHLSYQIRHLRCPSFTQVNSTCTKKNSSHNSFQHVINFPLTLLSFIMFSSANSFYILICFYFLFLM